VEYGHVDVPRPFHEGAEVRPGVLTLLDPNSEPTGNTCFALEEVYESPAGLADHCMTRALPPRAPQHCSRGRRASMPRYDQN